MEVLLFKYENCHFLSKGNCGTSNEIPFLEFKKYAIRSHMTKYVISMVPEALWFST